MKAQSSPSLRLPIGLAFFGFALVGMNSGANGVLLPSLSAFYHVGDAVIGLLFLVSSAGYFLSALSSGPLIERLELRSHIPQFTERKNRIVNTRDQGDGEPVDGELAILEPEFGSENQCGCARDQCPQNIGKSSASWGGRSV